MTGHVEADAVTHHLPEGLTLTPEIAGLLAAVRAADLALVTDDHAAALAGAGPELQVNSPADRVFGRDIFAYALANRMITYMRYERRIEHLSRRLTGEYLLMGAEKVTPKPDNQTYRAGAAHRRFTEIWRQDEGRWVLSVRQATNIPEPAAG